MPLTPGDRTNPIKSAPKPPRSGAKIPPLNPQSIAENFAEESGPTNFQKSHPWAYLDLACSLSFTKPTVSDKPEESPTLLQWGMGGTAAWRADLGVTEGGRMILLLGATSEYRWIGQYSKVNATVGNFKGSRFSTIAPTLGAQLGDEVVVKISPQIMGPYGLSNTTAEGSKLAYKGPSGFTAVGLLRAGKLIGSKHLHLGIQLEYLSFSAREIVGVSEHDLDPKLSWFLIGATVAYVF